MRTWLQRTCVGACAFVVASSALPGAAQAQQILPCSFGSGEGSGNYATVSEEGPYQIGEQVVVELASDVDGATIQMAIVRPEGLPNSRVPVILQASPYFHPFQTIDLRACEPFLTENFVPHGYAIAFLAVRGTGDSGGCMDLMGPNERGDIDQAVTWLGQQPWSNGSVGMVGLSFDGATQWEAASFGNPHLKTIVPVSGIPDIYEQLYGGGRVDWRGPLFYNDLYYAGSALFYTPGRDAQHTSEVLACPDYATGNAAALYSSTAGGLDPFGYWTARRYRDEIVKRYRGSVFLVQGLQDWNVDPRQQFPWVWELEKRGVHVKYLLGQWFHQWPHSVGHRMDWADDLKAWFDRWLKGDRSVSVRPRVEVQDDSGEWRAAGRWPDGNAATFFLSANSKLAANPSSTGGTVTVTTDPLHMQAGATTELPHENAACIPKTCAYFQTEPFEHGFRFAGVPRVKLTVVPQGPGGTLSVHLYAASSQGMDRLGWGQVNLRFRTSSTEPTPVTPGRKIQLTFDMQPLDSIVEPGERLYLVVSGGTAWNRLPSSESYPIDLFYGDRASSIQLVEEMPSPSAFFEPDKS